MGNTCSKEQQSDSVRVQKDNTSNEPSEVGEPCMLRIGGAPSNWKIYYRVLEIDGKFTITIFVKKPKPQNDGTVEIRIIPVCFFKMEKEPSRIAFDLSENESFSITAYISDETSREIAVHSIAWESNEYTVREEDGLFSECVKKIQRTDCSNLFVSVVSALHPLSLSVQDASTTGGGNASSASENVSPLNGPQIEVSEQVRIGQCVSTVSQIDESATHAPEVFKGDNGAGAFLMVNRDRLNTTCGTSTSQLSKITDLEERQTFAPCRPMTHLKKETGPNVEERQTFAPCGLMTPLKKETGPNVEPHQTPAPCSPTTPPKKETGANVELRQNLPQRGPPPSGTRTYPCLVTQFSGKGNTITFSVSDDDNCRSITYLNNSGEIQSVSLGVSKDTIKKINVYEICSGIYLILIHATNGLVYVSGYTNQRTAKSLTPLCVNNSFSENPKEFQKIEFLPPKTADNGSELQNRDFKLIFSRSLSKMYNINSNGELNHIPNTLK